MIGLEEARGLLARAVLTQGPDFVYNPGNQMSVCYNVPVDWDDGVAIEGHPARTTGCLVGTALSLGGVDVKDMPRGAGIHDFRASVEYDACVYFGSAQIVQDRGESWGAAYKTAENYYASLKAAQSA